MKVRAKKQEEDKISRVEASGEIKEIIINQDFIEPRKVSVSLYFRGEDSAGIVDLTPEEIGVINKEISSRKKLLKGVKIMKFKK
ncbi:MAG: hypothetical protein ABIH28_03290 [archaeon]